MGIGKLIKNYRTLGGKEFMRRFKDGVDSSTPLQQLKAQLVFTRITLLGIALGFFFSIFYYKNLWWLAIILGAALGNTYVSLIALKQKQKVLSQFEVTLAEINSQEEVKNV